METTRYGIGKACVDCGRTLISTSEWQGLPAEQRKSMRTAYARAWGSAKADRCEACEKYKRRGIRGARHRAGVSTAPKLRNPTRNDAYTGGWRRVGLILVPTQRRMENPEYAHGHLTGYWRHINADELPCGFCAIAYIEAEKTARGEDEQVAS